MTTEMKFNNFGKLKASWKIMRNTDSTLSEDFKDDVDALFEEAERVQGLEEEKEFFRNNLVELKAVENILKKENARLRELVKILKLHATHCDADGRAIQPYEIIDVINEFTAGETNGQHKA